MAHRAAHDFPQYVAPALIRRKDAVMDEECNRACVIRVDPQGDIGLWIPAKSDADDIGSTLNQR